MVALSIACLVLIVSRAVLSSPVTLRSPFVLKEKHRVPPRWTDVGTPHPLQMIDLQIGVKQGRFGELERHLHEVSDPFHSRYGQHLSKEEVEALVKPTKDTTARIADWLLDNGIAPSDYISSPAGDWIAISLPVSSVESLLDTQYSIYEHEDGTRLIRTTKWSLPSQLHDDIVTIQPTTAFLRANPHGKPVQEVIDEREDHEPLYLLNDGLSKVCNYSAVTPICLRTLYKTLNYTPQVPGQNKIGFTNYLGEYGNRSDAAIFLNKYRPEAVPSAHLFNQISIDGGKIDNGGRGGGLEGNLDLETILGLVWPTPATQYSTGGKPPFKPDLFTKRNTNEPYLAWVNYVLSQPAEEVPQVISTSYGDDEQTVPYSYALSVCNQFAQLGARGVSLFFSSGDEGVGYNGTCYLNDGTNSSAFLPSFPASCPYVTAVGGTKFHPEVVAFDPRNGYASGAGFSNYFPRPAWQEDAVQDYLPSISNKFHGLYNPLGRAYPDLAAQGYRYLIVYNDTTYSLDGTSCSAPAISSVFSLVNDALLAKGKPPMGWLNPWLYSIGGANAFNDVKGGSAIGCKGKGFEAGKGWDVASGWGTPDFERILDVLGVTPVGKVEEL